MDIETLIQKAVEKGIENVLIQQLPNILSSYLPKPDETPVDINVISAHVGLCSRTITKYRDQGKIPYIKVGKSYRYIKHQVVEALTKNGVI